MSCNDNTDEFTKQSKFAAKAEKQPQNVNISFSSAQPVDSTSYVIYPVYTSNDDEAGSYKRDGYKLTATLYFIMLLQALIICFTKEKCLSLPFTSKYADAFASDPELSVRTPHLIFYTVKVEDYNGDGKIGFR